MPVFRARQVAKIRDAIAAGRQAVRRAGIADPVVFARAFVEAEGAQRPDVEDAQAHAELGKQLLSLLAKNPNADSADPDIQRELRRAREQAKWAMLMEDDSVAGFLLQLSADALETPRGEALAHQSFGLGPGIFRKADIPVLQPECDGAVFLPISQHEIES
ncbi:hypothetical protein GH984_08760 [Spiribacter sp. C176]|uniref:Uncharacterized protein n=1 Tax=Spiribacter salilacus TaxID=2664894 RepID=A0A6N7QQW1_9GAMM|nr:hypothetical protein [Spiribacter salilacus]MRH78796.1 hypothetical protein [Spiribacter salilacus]